MRVAASLLLVLSLPLFAADAFLVRSDRICTNCVNIAVDINGDGLDDLVEGSLIRFNHDGGFGSPMRLTGFKPGEFAVVWGDFDGDGNADVIVHALAPGWMPNSLIYTRDRLLAGDGLGHFTAAPYAFASLGRATKALDVDGDGRLDLVLISDDHAIELLHNNGDGSFTHTRTIETPMTDIAAGDLDGDGVVDLVIAESAYLHFHFADRDITRFAGIEPIAIRIADVNGDARLDLIIDDASNTYGITALLGDGTGAFPNVTRVSGFVADDNLVRTAIGDFFAGGGVEIANAQEHEVKVYSATGDRLHEVAQFTLDGSGRSSSTIAGNFVDGAQREIIAHVAFGNRHEELLLAGEGSILSGRRRAVGRAFAEPIAGTWSVNDDSSCPLPLSSLTLTREGMFVTSEAGPLAYLPDDEVLIVRWTIGERTLTGDLHVTNGKLEGLLEEQESFCTGQSAKHHLVLSR